MHPTYSLNLIFASVAAIYCLLGYWLAFGKQPWIWRAGAVCAALALLVPIRAYEPLVFFAITSLLFLGAAGSSKLLALARQRRTSKDDPDAGQPSPAKPRFQFRLHDLFALMAIIGAGAFLVRVILREQVWLPWIGTLISSVVSVAMTLTLVGLLRGPRRVVSGVILVLVIGASTAYFHWLHRQVPLGLPVEYIIGEDLGDQLFGPPLPFSLDHCDAAFHLLVLLLISLVFLAIFLGVKRAIRPAEGRPVRHRVWQSLGIATCLVWLLPMTWLYCQLLSYPQPPQQIRNRPNGLPTLLQRGQMLELLAGAQARTASAEVIELSKQTGFILIPWEAGLRERKSYQDNVLSDEIQFARSISRGLESQAVAVEATDPNLSVEPLLACLRLGNMLEHEGLMVHGLVGYAIDITAAGHLIRLRDKISVSKMRDIIALIESQENSRDDGDVARDKLWYSLNDRWAFRLDQVLHASEEHGGNWSYYYFSVGSKRNACIKRLLMVDLALRAYHAEHGEYPSKLDSLVPKYLAQIPLDPFVEKPFIYRRTDQGEFVLYSVGKDEVDNGGLFDPPGFMLGPYAVDGYGYDLKLDVPRE